MRKKIFGIAVAMLTMLSACETINTQEGIAGSGAEVTVSDRATLTASIGTDTKTYLEWDGSVYKTRWAEDDALIVLDLNVSIMGSITEGSYCWFDIDEGVGESTATFVAEDKNYVLPDSFIAAYGEIWPEETGQWMIWVSNSQAISLYENKDGEIIQGFGFHRYPMVALGNGTSSVEFKNLCSVLKVNITGNGEHLQNVKVESLDEGVYLSGEALLNLEDSRPTLIFSPEDEGTSEVEVYNHINFNTKMSYYDEELGVVEQETILSLDPVECYIVLPAQTYPSGLKLTIQTDEGLMEVNTEQNLVFTQSELREIPQIEYKSSVAYEGEWKLSQDDIITMITETEGDYLVLKNYYIEQYGRLLFYDENTIGYGISQEYGRQISQFTNTCVQLDQNGNEMVFYVPGYYDIYIDKQDKKVFVMSAGVSINDIPTTDNVVCHDYYRIRDEIADDEMVKIAGRVSATYDGGFIVTLDFWGIDILVNTYSSSTEQKTALAGIEKDNFVELYAVKGQRYGLPLLEDVKWSRINKSNSYVIHGANIITPNFEGYNSDYYTFIGYVGTLNYTGGYWNIYVEGSDTYVGSIYYPLDDLSQYNGKEVYVEGFFCGVSGSTPKYINTVLTKILLPNVDGSTEDVIPDDDIVIPTR